MEMNKEREEELQRQAEQHLLRGADPDSRAYQIVFDALHRDTGLKPSPRLADQVVQRLRQQAAAQPANEYFWFGFGIMLIIAAAIVAVMLTDFTPDLGFLKGISRYFNLFIFGALFILAIQWLDKKFIRKLTIH